MFTAEIDKSFLVLNLLGVETLKSEQLEKKTNVS